MPRIIIRIIILLFTLIFLTGCTIKAEYTDGTITHTIESRRNTLVHYKDGKIDMTADFRPRRTWSLLFPSIFNKSNDINWGTGD